MHRRKTSEASADADGEGSAPKALFFADNCVLNCGIFKSFQTHFFLSD
jgi:hypothetical protein